MLEKELLGTYQINLVLISVMVAILATYASINLASRIKGRTNTDRWILFVSSFVLGGGIWTMHFIGMEAFHLGINIVYNPFLVLLSFLWPVTVSYLSFWLIWQNRKKRYIRNLSGVILGLGIAGMHYTGMKSMEMVAEITYDPLLFTISIAISIIVSVIGVHYFALLIKGNLIKKIGGALFFGLAVSSVHYTGMSSARFTIHEHDMHSGLQYGSNSILSLILSLFVLFIFVIILVTSLMEEQYTYKLKESEEQYRSIVEMAPIGIAVHQFGVISYINPTGMEILGAAAMKDIVGRNVLEFIHPDFHDQVKSRWKTIREQNQPVAVLEEKMIRLNREIINVEMKGVPFINDGESSVQIFFNDITARKKAEEMIYHLAFHDPLTELPNRRMFLERLNQALQEIQGMKKGIAVMFLDLDEFKKVNDTLGHDAGDLLLINVAKSLIRCVREKDTISRLAGDEFAIMLPDVDRLEAESIAKNILEGLQLPLTIIGKKLHVTPSIGIAIALDGKEAAETLLKQADIAMYQAKRQGKNTYQVYQ